MMKTGGNNFINKEVTANMIASDEVTFLCGEETLVKWRTTLSFRKRKLGFKEHEKEVQLIKGSHLLAKLELVGKQKILKCNIWLLDRAKIEEEQPPNLGEDLIKNY